MQMVTQKAFADLLDVAKSYVTKLKQDGRLVMVDGKVDVEASKARIESTKDANRDDVSKRWDHYRQNEPQDDQETASESAEAFGNSRAAKMYYDAQSAKLAFERESGKLVEIELVQKLATTAATVMRQNLERLPDRMATELAEERDQGRIHALMVERIEEALANLAREVSTGMEALQL